MQRHYFLWLSLSLMLLALPFISVHASGNEVEIELLEISGFLPGDNPQDGPKEEGATPPRPNEFRATINGQTLAITSGVHSAQVIVRDGSGSTVLNTQFVGGTIEQLPLAGLYSLEIQSGSLTLVGAFEVQ